MKMKKILVTGAGGFIGSHLTEMLVKQGYRVCAFVHYNSRNDSGWLDYSLAKKEITIEKGDICNFDSVYRVVKKVDAVCHLAALIGIPYSYISPLAYIRTNIEGTYNLLESARQLGGKTFIHTSTSEVYGNAQYLPIDERHPLAGQSPYSASKIGADQLALSYARAFDLPVTIIRPFNTFGPRQSLRAIIPTIISNLLSDKDFLELGNTSSARDFTYVTDTCAGFIKALKTPKGIGRVINLGTGSDITVVSLANKIMKLTGRKIEIKVDIKRMRPDKSEVSRLQSDNRLAKKILSWQPEVSLEEGLIKTIDFIQRNISLYNFDEYVV